MRWKNPSAGAAGRVAKAQPPVQHGAKDAAATFAGDEKCTGGDETDQSCRGAVMTTVCWSSGVWRIFISLPSLG